MKKSDAENIIIITEDGGSRPYNLQLTEYRARRLKSGKDITVYKKGYTVNLWIGGTAYFSSSEKLPSTYARWTWA